MIKDKIFFLTLLTIFYLTPIFAQEKPISDGKEVKLDKESRKKLCVFFSNFSEVNLDYFEKSKTIEHQLIRFSIEHNIINNHKAIKQIGKTTKGLLDPKFVEAAVKKYFGLSIKKHQTVADIKNSTFHEYENGKYILPYAFSIEDNPEVRFSSILKLYDIGNNYFIADVYNISIGMDFSEEDRYADPEILMKGGKEFDYTRIKATIQKITEEGKTRYILIEYLEYKYIFSK
jgi:hypothetical protein